MSTVGCEECGKTFTLVRVFDRAGISPHAPCGNIARMHTHTLGKLKYILVGTVESDPHYMSVVGMVHHGQPGVCWIHSPALPTLSCSLISTPTIVLDKKHNVCGGVAG
jgi:hypothetical protein